MIEPILDKVGNRSMVHPLYIDPLLAAFIGRSFKDIPNSLSEICSFAWTVVAMAVCLVCEYYLRWVLKCLIYSSGTSVTFLRENWQNVCGLGHIVSPRRLKGGSRLLKRLLARLLIH